MEKTKQMVRVKWWRNGSKRFDGLKQDIAAKYIHMDILDKMEVGLDLDGGSGWCGCGCTRRNRGQARSHQNEPPSQIHVLSLTSVAGPTDETT